MNVNVTEPGPSSMGYVQVEDRSESPHHGEKLWALPYSFQI